MPILDELQTNDTDTTYFAFRVPTKVHRNMRAVLARRGISGQAYFLRVIEQLLADENAEESFDGATQTKV